MRPLDANRARSGDLILRLLVRPVVDEPRPAGAARRVATPGWCSVMTYDPSVRQRFAAYARGHSSRGLLATEYSDRTAVTGRWGMPGGGLDDHEPPTSAVLREVAEETSQQIILGELIKVQTSHWVGRSPYGTIEDFHAVRLIYRATCAASDGPGRASTRAARPNRRSGCRWTSWRSVSWTKNWQLMLSRAAQDSGLS